MRPAADSRSAALRQLRERKPAIRAFLTDDGGVLNQNRLRGPEYRRLIGEFFPARLGGTAQQWSRANETMFGPLWSDFQKRIEDFRTHREFQREYEIRWISSMCASAGVQTPPDDVAMTLAREAAVYVSRRAAAEVDGAAEAVWSLRRVGYELQMASGTPSWELEGILHRMGIREAFAGICGPDVIDHVKHGPEFYRRILAHARLTPGECVVIESSQACCGWAMEAGAHAIRVDCDHDATPTLAEIAAVIVECENSQRP